LGMGHPVNQKNKCSFQLAVNIIYKARHGEISYTLDQT
jgi:hypothetical protein